MAETNSQVSDQPGDEGLPTPQFSGKGDSSTSTDADAIVSKLTPILEQIVERKVQSVKDKRFSEIEKALGGREKMLAELEESGVSIPKEVRTQMQIRELQERLAQQPQQPVSVSNDGSLQPKTAVEEALAQLSENGLTSNDPAFIEILRGTYRTREAFDLQVQKYIVGKLKPPKPANPADVVQAPARGGQTPPNAETLLADYKQEMQAAPRGPRGDAQRRAIKDKFTKQGVNVDSVDFTS